MNSRQKTLLLVGLAALCALAGMAVVAPLTSLGEAAPVPLERAEDHLLPPVDHTRYGRTVVDVDAPESIPEDGKRGAAK